MVSFEGTPFQFMPTFPTFPTEHQRIPTKPRHTLFIKQGFIHLGSA